MRKSGKIKRVVAAVMSVGITACIPVAVAMPMSVMAADTDDTILTLNQSEGGQISSDAGSTVKLGEVFNLTATPDEGYRFAYWHLKSGGYHEIVNGSESDSNISVRVDESNGELNLFRAEAVFVKDGVYTIESYGMLSQDTAGAGDVIDIGRPFYKSWDYYNDDGSHIFGREDISIFRTSDDKDITDEVADIENNTFVMPEADIRIIGSAVSGIYRQNEEIPYEEKILDGFEEENAIFSIQNDSVDVELPSGAEVGTEVQIEITNSTYNRYLERLQNGDDNVSVTNEIRIERISDGMDMTETLMTDESHTSFIMPYYDVRITGGVGYASSADFIEVNDAAQDDVNAESADNVLSSYQPDEADDKSDYGGGEQNELVKPAVSGSSKKEATVSAVKATPVATEVTGLGSAVTATAPSVIRAEGSSTATSSVAKAPATGDYNITAAVTIAAVAAGVGIVTAAVMLKKRMTD